MSIITDVKDTILDAKKKYDKERYIGVLEEQVNKLEDEIGRLNTMIARLQESPFLINNDHLKLFELFKNNNYEYYLEDIEVFAKSSIDLEIALSELLENGYFEMPSMYAMGYKICLSIPESKKIELLYALKNKL